MEVRLSPPQLNDDDLFERFVFLKEHERVMDQYGYYQVASRLIPDEATSLVEKQVLDLLASPQPAKHLTPADNRMEWRRFIEHGINLDTALLSHFGTTKGVIRQGPIIHHLAHSSTGKLGRVHPCHEGISIWRPIREGLGPENGLFKVYPGSHKIKSKEELLNSKINAVEIRIRADQVLIAHGGLWIEEGSGDGLVMWMGVSREIIGLHIDTYCLAFVAAAYNALPLLSRCRPLIEEETELAPRDLSLALNSRQTGSETRRSETANSILFHAREHAIQIQNFLAETDDPTGSILLACDDANDRGITYLSAGRDEDPQKWLLRAIILRSIILSKGSKSISNFLKEKGLSDSATGPIQYGDKVYLTERELENPSIWVALMKVLPRFKDLRIPDASCVPHLLTQGYRDIVDAVSPWSPLVVSSSQLHRLVWSMDK